jgi:hypothetical protein
MCRAFHHTLTTHSNGGTYLHLYSSLILFKVQDLIIQQCQCISQWDFGLFSQPAARCAKNLKYQMSRTSGLLRLITWEMFLQVQPVTACQIVQVPKVRSKYPPVSS